MQYAKFLTSDWLDLGRSVVIPGLIEVTAVNMSVFVIFAIFQNPEKNSLLL